MKKRAIVVISALLVLCAALAHAQIYGTSTGIVRSNYLPVEDNIHFQRQENFTLLSLERLGALEQQIANFQGQVSSIQGSVENQRVDFATQLQGINRGIEGLRTEVTAIKQQMREIPPQLEKPQAIIPPISLLILGLANLLLLIVVIVLMFWLRSNIVSERKSEHLEEHAQIHLVDYIREAMHRGASMKDIRRRLLDRGWSESKIDEAIQEVRAMH